MCIVCVCVHVRVRVCARACARVCVCVRACVCLYCAGVVCRSEGSGLPAQIMVSLNIGLSGMPFSGSDIGTYIGTLL